MTPGTASLHLGKQITPGSGEDESYLLTGLWAPSNSNIQKKACFQKSWSQKMLSASSPCPQWWECGNRNRTQWW